MNKIILTIGASASGKSTWAENFVKENPEYVNINRDDIRFSLFNNGIKDWTKYKFNRANERKVTEFAERLVFEAVEKGKSIVISDTNLNPSIRQKWKDWAVENEYEYSEMFFEAPYSTLVKRNAQRQGGIPENILFDQYKRYMRQFGYYGDHRVKVYEENPTLEHCVLADLDGTIADMKGVRKPFDWHSVKHDKPRYEVITMLDALAMRNGNVIFMSGRDGSCYQDTLAWIEQYVTSDWHESIKGDLVMRAEGDSRKDDAVKYELYKEHIEGKYNVAAVLDDRYSVIRMWTVLGLPNIIQVGEYNNEF